MLENIGSGEILVILFIVFIFFGPSKLPEIGKSLGKGILNFRKSLNDVKENLNLDASLNEIKGATDLKKTIDEIRDSVDIKKNFINEIKDSIDIRKTLDDINKTPNG